MGLAVAISGEKSDECATPQGRGLGREGLCADCEAQLDVGLDLACVECAVEGAEFDRSGRPLEEEGGMQVQ